MGQAKCHSRKIRELFQLRKYNDTKKKGFKSQNLHSDVLVLFQPNYSNWSQLKDSPVNLDGKLERFHCYETILKTQEVFNTSYTFFFPEITEGEVQKQTLRLDGRKTTPVGDIPSWMLKSTVGTHASILTKVFILKQLLCSRWLESCTS